PRLHQLRQLTAVYIYCGNEAANREWSESYSKVRANHKAVPGSIFCTEDVQYDEEEGMWIAQLALCSNDAYELKKLMIRMKEETEGITSLSWFLYRKGKYSKATQYFAQLLVGPSINDVDRSNCYRGLGYVSAAIGEHN
ncbi:unnamed protein product, partial [Didymodactylos carnosus]